jgi:hypothetical protein
MDIFGRSAAIVAANLGDDEPIGWEIPPRRKSIPHSVSPACLWLRPSRQVALWDAAVLVDSDDASCVLVATFQIV